MFKDIDLMQKNNNVKAFVVTPHEMWEILVIYVFEMIFIGNS